MERQTCFEDLPYLAFKAIIEFLPWEDVLNLSAVSAGVREMINGISLTLRSFYFKKMNPKKLRHLADQDLKIKDLYLEELTETFECWDKRREDQWDFEDFLIKHPELERFYAKNNSISSIGNKSFEKLISHKGMKSLSLHCLQLIGENVILAESKYSESLHTLEITEVDFEEYGPSWYNIVRNLHAPSKLRTLNFNEADLADADLSHIFKIAPYIESLNVAMTNITGVDGLECSSVFIHFKELNLSKCYELTDQGLRIILEKTPNLTVLKLKESPVTFKGFQGLNNLDKLVDLDLSSSQDFLNPCRALTYSGISSFLRKTPNLTSLNLAGTVMTDEGFIDIEPLDKLVTLDLSATDGLSSLLRYSPNLTSLLFVNSNTKGLGFKYIKPLKKLVNLNLSSCKQLAFSGLCLVLEKTPNLELFVFSSEKIVSKGEDLKTLIIPSARKLKKLVLTDSNLIYKRV